MSDVIHAFGVDYITTLINEKDQNKIMKIKNRKNRVNFTKVY